MSECFYHLLPEKMKGKELMPLSSLEEEHPDLAKAYVKGYKGRENLLSKKIPPLDCQWKDVIFLSAINPILIFSALELLGLLNKNPPKVLQFDIKTLKNEEFAFSQEHGKKEIFSKGSVAKYKEEHKIPEDTIKYFVKSISSGEDPLIFYGIPHVLLKGNLALSSAKIIEYQSLIK